MANKIQIGVWVILTLLNAAVVALVLALGEFGPFNLLNVLWTIIGPGYVYYFYREVRRDKATAAARDRN